MQHLILKLFAAEFINHSDNYRRQKVKAPTKEKKIYSLVAIILFSIQKRSTPPVHFRLKYSPIPRIPNKIFVGYTCVRVRARIYTYNFIFGY